MMQRVMTQDADIWNEYKYWYVVASSCAKILNERRQEHAESDVQLDKNVLFAYNLGQSLGAHDFTGDARVAIWIDLLSR